MTKFFKAFLKIYTLIYIYVINAIFHHYFFLCTSDFRVMKKAIQSCELNFLFIYLFYYCYPGFINYFASHTTTES